MRYRPSVWILLAMVFFLGGCQQRSAPPPAVDAAAQQAKQLVRRYFDDVLSKGNVAAVDELIGEAFVLNGPPSVSREPLRGVQTFKQMVPHLRTIFPDLSFTVEDVVAEHDVVMASWTMRGTHRGEWLGVPATGKVVTMTGVDVFRINAGKLQEVRIHGDYLGALRQLGALPDVK